MDSQRITPYRPLPPQRWGFLATNQFWSRAWLTPISIVFWAGAAVFFSLFDLFALVWWQQALGFLAFYGVWGGLVERYSRKYLARQRVRALAGPRTDPPEGPADAAAETTSRALPEPPDASSRALVPSREPRPEPSLVATAETWDDGYERLFGRGAAVAQLVSNVAFGLAIFYPSWPVKLLAFLALLVTSLGLGLWQRRRAMPAGGEVPPEALETGAGAPNAELGGAGSNTAGRSPGALPHE
ncbi:hypothetical protein [Nannocystis bainbridge]|uniref:DUF2628 domain-containing protein n=1 Tax=Nannocystis bainbridge TaxID=2995303 RepID=A0ABT5DW12_9BACT|nr:hypothetical protein [Nannocystis bainbridge]MDC0717824.1 hypothetical protein [Nannocystis bainbridge]